MANLPPPRLDRTRLAYVLRARMDACDFSYRDTQRATGVPITQISRVINCERVLDGTIYMLAEFFDIDLAEMMPPATMARILEIRREKDQRIQAVSHIVTRETSGVEA